MKNRYWLLSALLFLPACFPYPGLVQQKISLRVVDDSTSEPIPGAEVAVDVSTAVFGKPERSTYTTNEDGLLDVPSRRRWSIYIMAPDAMPFYWQAIFVMKPGYKTLEIRGLDENEISEDGRVTVRLRNS